MPNTQLFKLNTLLICIIPSHSKLSLHESENNHLMAIKLIKSLQQTERPLAIDLEFRRRLTGCALGGGDSCLESGCVGFTKWGSGSLFLHGDWRLRTPSMGRHISHVCLHFQNRETDRIFYHSP